MALPRTLPSSPTRSFSSSDFEFTVIVSPRKSTSSLCPVDELFYKGQLSPRISMVRNLLLSASSCSASEASRDSTGSSTDSLLLDSSCCDSSRPSSVTADHPEYDDHAKLTNDPNNKSRDNGARCDRQGKYKARHGYFGLSKFSFVFLRKEIKHQQHRETAAPGPVKRMSATAKEVIGKYLKKVKPIYEKRDELPLVHAFVAEPLRGARRRPGLATGYSDVSLMEELKSAIREAIAHRKNSMLQNKGR